MVLDYIAAALTLLLKAFTFWFFLTALAFWKRPMPYEHRAPKTRFACLIPARNEEAVVAALVRSLREQNYPDALYDIYVIPNNCTDDTGARQGRLAQKSSAVSILCAARATRCMRRSRGCCRADTTRFASLTRTTSYTPTFSPA